MLLGALLVSYKLVEQLIFWGSIIIDEFMDPGQGAGG